MSLMTGLRRAADVIQRSEALIITAGAGMGVDSGLPDYRGAHGLWKAYPPLKGMSLSDISTPHWFDADPRLAWGFFGHRYNLYKDTSPHQGFEILKRWADGMKSGYFVYTSNVDGQFQRAGFHDDRIVECHGTINYLQSVDPTVNSDLWQLDDGVVFDVDEETLRLTSDLPTGPPGYSTLARPNIKMFNDVTWVSSRTDAQYCRYQAFIDGTLTNAMWYSVVEIGAGMAVDRVRRHSVSIAESRAGGTLIRINPANPEVESEDHIGLDVTGLEALKALDEMIRSP